MMRGARAIVLLICLFWEEVADQCEKERTQCSGNTGLSDIGPDNFPRPVLLVCGMWNCETRGIVIQVA